MLQDLLFFVDNYFIAIEQRVKIPHKKTQSSYGRYIFLFLTVQNISSYLEPAEKYLLPRSFSLYFHFTDALSLEDVVPIYIASAPQYNVYSCIILFRCRPFNLKQSSCQTSDFLTRNVVE